MGTVGLGANVGASLSQLASAVARLRVTLLDVTVSSVYRTAPLGFAQQPDFLNLVCAGTTTLAPEALLARLHQIEREMGRVRSFPNAPRVIDLDLLAYGDVVRASAELTLPHPRLHERAFVLVPLAEIAPEWRHPVLGLTPAQLLARLPAPQRVERIGALGDLARALPDGPAGE